MVMYRKEGADEEWAREYPELAAGQIKSTRSPGLNLTEFAIRMGVTEGPERDRGIEVWQQSGADTGDYVEMVSVHAGITHTKRALIRVCTSAGVYLGLYLGGLLVRFDQIQAVTVIQQAGTFYLKDIPAEGRRGYRTQLEMDSRKAMPPPELD
jgi:hypothetical protein